MSNHVCIICFEEFELGHTKAGFEVCQNCIKTNIETHKRVNLYANGGNFPLSLYYLNFDAKSLTEIVVLEEKRFEMAKNEALINSVMENCGVSYQMINETIVMYAFKKAGLIRNSTAPFDFVIAQWECMYEPLVHQNTFIDKDQITMLVNFAKKFSIVPFNDFKDTCKKNLVLIYKFLPKIKAELMNHYVNPTVNQGRCDHCRDGVYFNFKCNKCDSVKCELCGMTYTSDKQHLCKQEDIERYKIDKTLFKNCPSCYVPVERIQGCPDMWCKNCHKMFNWNTLEIINKHRHNPDRIEFAQRIGNRLEEELIIDFEVYQTMLEETMNKLNTMGDVEGYEFYKDITLAIRMTVRLIDESFCSKLYSDKSKFLFMYHNKYTLNELNALASMIDFNIIQEIDVTISLETYECGSDLIDYLTQKAAYVFQNILVNNYEEARRNYFELIDEVLQKSSKLSIPMDKHLNMLL